jgi:hypothetical protein
MKMLKILLRNMGMISGFALSLTAFTGTAIRVIELDSNGAKANTFEMKSRPPEKELVVEKNGKKALNTDQSNSQEAAIRKLLNANFDLNYLCLYREYDEYSKRHPEKEQWEIEELFAAYIENNKIKLKKQEECFAEELDSLLNAHPCLRKYGTINFYVMPLPLAPAFDKHMGDRDNTDERRVVGVTVAGCPYRESNELLTACTYKRDKGQTEKFFGPAAWAEYVKKCTAEFKKPEIRQLADATMSSPHTR